MEAAADPKQQPKADTPGSEKRYKKLYETGKKKQKEKAEKVLELAGTDKECTFAPALTYELKNGKLQASPADPKAAPGNVFIFFEKLVPYSFSC